MSRQGGGMVQGWGSMKVLRGMTSHVNTLHTHAHLAQLLGMFVFVLFFPKCLKTATLRPRSCFSRPMMQKTEREADDGGAYGFPLLPLPRPPQPRQRAPDWVYEWTAGLASRRGPRENRAFDSGHILCV